MSARTTACRESSRERESEWSGAGDIKGTYVTLEHVVAHL